VLHLLVSEPLDCRVVDRAFDTAVPAQVVVRAVAVGFAFRLVVFTFLRNKVVKSESVVARYEINALFSFTLFMTVNGRTTQQTIGKRSHRIFVAAKEPPNVVSKPAIPLLPTVADEAADLVKPRRIPGLGDQLCPSQLWVRFNIP